VEQTSTPPGFTILPGASPATVTISAAQAQGTPGTVVDTFDGTAQTLMVPQSSSDSSSVVDAQAIGGRRDMFASELSNNGGIIFSSNGFSGGNTLRFNPSNSNRGRYLVTWDGDATVTTDDPTTLNPTGLGGVDLTDAGATSAFRMVAGIQGVGQTLTLRVYTNGASFSTATVALPDTGGNISQEILVPFSSFTVGGGSGADFTNVGAVQLDHTATVIAADGGLDQLATLGPTFVTQNFSNISPLDLVLTKTVSDDSPPLNGTVTFTVTVQNSGPADATGIRVSDTLPTGLTLLNATPSQGTFDSATGLWTVGSLANGASANLQLAVRVDTVGKKINNATISGVDQTESNLNNNSAMAMLTPEAVDLAVTKTASQAMPNVGSPFTFTIIATNNGPSAVTNASVSDVLPNTLTFNGATATQGDYNANTGTWTIGALAVNGSASLTINVTPTTSDKVTNTARVSAGQQVDTNAANDEASVMVMPIIPANPGIQLVKATNGTAQNSATGGPTVFAGSPVTFTYTVTNTGNVPLSNVQVRDDNGTVSNSTDDFFATFQSGDRNTNRQLDLTEAWIYSAQRTATVGTHVNRATATGVGEGQNVSAQSVSNHTGLQPAQPRGKRRFLATSFRT
jgi:uncharacterized repeat protein (TIGR01451 family)